MCVKQKKGAKRSRKEEDGLRGNSREGKREEEKKEEKITRKEQK